MDERFKGEPKERADMLVSDRLVLVCCLEHRTYKVRKGVIHQARYESERV